MSIKELSIKNYRTFKDETNFKLKRINFLVGPNNSGKSSISHVLDNLKNSHDTFRFSSFLPDISKQLGDFDNVLNISDSELGIVINLGGLKVGFGYDENYTNLYYKSSFNILTGSRSACDFGIVLGEDEWINNERYTSNCKLYLNYINNQIDSINVKVGDSFLVKSKRVAINPYENIPDSEILHFNSYVNYYIEVELNLYLISSYYEKYAKSSLGKEIRKEFDLFKEFSKKNESISLKKIVPEFNVHVITKYLFGFIDVRNYDFKTGEIFSCSVEEDEFHKFDLFVSSFMATLLCRIDESLRIFKISNNDVVKKRFFDINSESDKKVINSLKSKKELSNFVNNFNIADNIMVKKVGIGIFEILCKKNGRFFNIFDMGTGVTSLMEIMLVVNEYNYNQFVILEEPETHLHPKWQSLLAEYLLKSSATLLIETHSEYMIRKAQVMVAKGEVKPEDVGIIYLGEDPNAPDYVRHIDILPNGRLSQDFGPGFFDESTKLLVELMQYGGLN